MIWIILHDLPNYTISHQKRSDCKGGGVSVYIHNSLNFRAIPDLSTNCENIESLTLQINTTNYRTVETNLAKYVGLLSCGKPLLEEKSLKSIYFAYIHSYLNYANIAWASTYRTKLKTIHFHQKHAARIVFNEEKLTQSRPLLRSLNALNVYQINLYQHLAFMYKLNKNKAPLTFNELIKKPFHKYPTKFSENHFDLKAISLKSTKYCISFRGPKIWNKFLTKEEKELQSFSIF